MISANPRIIGPYSILSNHPISSSQNRYLGISDLNCPAFINILKYFDILKCPYHPIIPYCCYHPIIQHYPPKGNPDLGAALIKLSSFVAIARPLQPFPSQTVIINVIVIIAIIIIIVNDYHRRPHQQNFKQYLDCNCLSPSTFSLQNILIILITIAFLL